MRFSAARCRRHGRKPDFREYGDGQSPRRHPGESRSLECEPERRRLHRRQHLWDGVKGAKGLAEVKGLDHAKNRDKAIF